MCAPNSGDDIVTQQDIIDEFGHVLAYKLRDDRTLVVIHANGQKHFYPGWVPIRLRGHQAVEERIEEPLPGKKLKQIEKAARKKKDHHVENQTRRY